MAKTRKNKQIHEMPGGTQKIKRKKPRDEFGEGDEQSKDKKSKDKRRKRNNENKLKTEFLEIQRRSFDSDREINKLAEKYKQEIDSRVSQTKGEVESAGDLSPEARLEAEKDITELQTLAQASKQSIEQQEQGIDFYTKEEYLDMLTVGWDEGVSRALKKYDLEKIPQQKLQAGMEEMLEKVGYSGVVEEGIELTEDNYQKKYDEMKKGALVFVEKNFVDEKSAEKSEAKESVQAEVLKVDKRGSAEIEPDIFPEDKEKPKEDGKLAEIVDRWDKRLRSKKLNDADRLVLEKNFKEFTGQKWTPDFSVKNYLDKNKQPAEDEKLVKESSAKPRSEENQKEAENFLDVQEIDALLRNKNLSNSDAQKFKKDLEERFSIKWQPDFDAAKFVGDILRLKQIDKLLRSEDLSEEETNKLLTEMDDKYGLNWTPDFDANKFLEDFFGKIKEEKTVSTVLKTDTPPENKKINKTGDDEVAGGKELEVSKLKQLDSALRQNALSEYHPSYKQKMKEMFNIDWTPEFEVEKYLAASRDKAQADADSHSEKEEAQAEISPTTKPATESTKRNLEKKEFSHDFENIQISSRIFEAALKDILTKDPQILDRLKIILLRKENQSDEFSLVGETVKAALAEYFSKMNLPEAKQAEIAKQLDGFVGQIENSVLEQLSSHLDYKAAEEIGFFSKLKKNFGNVLNKKTLMQMGATMGTVGSITLLGVSVGLGSWATVTAGALAGVARTGIWAWGKYKQSKMTAAELQAEKDKELQKHNEYLDKGSMRLMEKYDFTEGGKQNKQKFFLSAESLAKLISGTVQMESLAAFRKDKLIDPEGNIDKSVQQALLQRISEHIESNPQYFDLNPAQKKIEKRKLYALFSRQLLNERDLLEMSKGANFGDNEKDKALKVIQRMQGVLSGDFAGVRSKSDFNFKNSKKEITGLFLGSALAGMGMRIAYGTGAGSYISGTMGALAGAGLGYGFARSREMSRYLKTFDTQVASLQKESERDLEELQKILQTGISFEEKRKKINLFQNKLVRLEGMLNLSIPQPGGEAQPLLQDKVLKTQVEAFTMRANKILLSSRESEIEISDKNFSLDNFISQTQLQLSRSQRQAADKLGKKIENQRKYNMLYRTVGLAVGGAVGFLAGKYSYEGVQKGRDLYNNLFADNETPAANLESPSDKSADKMVDKNGIGTRGNEQPADSSQIKSELKSFGLYDGEAPADTGLAKEDFPVWQKLGDESARARIYSAIADRPDKNKEIFNLNNQISQVDSNLENGRLNQAQLDYLEKSIKSGSAIDDTLASKLKDLKSPVGSEKLEAETKTQANAVKKQMSTAQEYLKNKISTDNLSKVIDADSSIGSAATIESGQFEYTGAGNVWSEIAKQLNSRAGFKEHFSGLEPEEQTHAIDYFKDRVVANPEKYGIAKDVDVDNLSKEELSNVKWNEIFKDAEVEKWGPSLSEEAKMNIRENNRLLKEFVAKTGGKIESEQVDNLLENIKKAGGVDEYIASAAATTPEITSVQDNLNELTQVISQADSPEQLVAEVSNLDISPEGGNKEELWQAVTEKLRSFDFPEDFKAAGFYLDSKQEAIGIVGDYQNDEYLLEAGADLKVDDIAKWSQAGSDLRAYFQEHPSFNLKAENLKIDLSDQNIKNVAWDLPFKKSAISLTFGVGEGDLYVKNADFDSASLPANIAENVKELPGYRIDSLEAKVLFREIGNEVAKQSVRAHAVEVMQTRLGQTAATDALEHAEHLDKLNQYLDKYPETANYLTNEKIAQELVEKYPDKSQLLKNIQTNSVSSSVDTVPEPSPNQSDVKARVEKQIESIDAEVEKKPVDSDKKDYWQEKEQEVFSEPVEESSSGQVSPEAGNTEIVKHIKVKESGRILQEIFPKAKNMNSDQFISNVESSAFYDLSEKDKVEWADFFENEIANKNLSPQDLKDLQAKTWRLFDSQAQQHETLDNNPEAQLKNTVSEKKASSYYETSKEIPEQLKKDVNRLDWQVNKAGLNDMYGDELELKQNALEALSSLKKTVFNDPEYFKNNIKEISNRLQIGPRSSEELAGLAKKLDYEAVEMIKTKTGVEVNFWKKGKLSGDGTYVFMKTV